mmetsp:Transcript_43714/g.103216  ORF Transcript_43714/g.103216 Transcript_43714/m.103216 type:complete len:555 (+) Transcript_43714:95-1759(+)
MAILAEEQQHTDASWRLSQYILKFEHRYGALDVVTDAEAVRKAPGRRGAWNRACRSHAASTTAVRQAEGSHVVRSSSSSALPSRSSAPSTAAGAERCCEGRQPQGTLCRRRPSCKCSCCRPAGRQTAHASRKVSPPGSRSSISPSPRCGGSVAAGGSALPTGRTSCPSARSVLSQRPEEPRAPVLPTKCPEKEHHHAAMRHVMVREPVCFEPVPGGWPQLAFRAEPAVLVPPPAAAAGAPPWSKWVCAPAEAMQMPCHLEKSRCAHAAAAAPAVQQHQQVQSVQSLCQDRATAWLEKSPLPQQRPERARRPSSAPGWRALSAPGDAQSTCLPPPQGPQTQPQPQLQQKQQLQVQQQPQLQLPQQQLVWLQPLEPQISSEEISAEIYGPEVKMLSEHVQSSADAASLSAMKDQLLRMSVESAVQTEDEWFCVDTLRMSSADLVSPRRSGRGLAGDHGNAASMGGPCIRNLLEHGGKLQQEAREPRHGVQQVELVDVIQPVHCARTPLAGELHNLLQENTQRALMHIRSMRQLLKEEAPQQLLQPQASLERQAQRA